MGGGRIFCVQLRVLDTGIEEGSLCIEEVIGKELTVVLGTNLDF